MKKPTLARFFWYLLAVPHCTSCRKVLEPEEALSGMLGSDVLCGLCRAGWEQEKLAVCPTCGRAHLDCRCMPDRLREAGAAGLVHLGEYRADAVIGKVILRLKDAALRRAADFAAAQLVPAVRREAAVWEVEPVELLVIWLPRSRSARMLHGHDQAELLARALARRLGAVSASLLIRTGDGQAQKTLTAGQRAENVRGLFAVQGELCAGRHILLVDDVVTTGASMAEGVRLLREAGAERVICAAVGMSSKKNAENAKK